MKYVIGVSNQDLKLFPGMTANVKILVSQRKNVLRIPTAALRYHPATEAGASRSGGKDSASGKAVWILDAKNTPQRVVITTGDTDGTNTEVTGGGLKDGDRVIVAAFARPGAASSSSPGVPGGSPGGRGGPRF